MWHPLRAYRDRLQTERAAERAHQLAVIAQVTKVIEASLDSAAQQNARNADAMLEMARAGGKQADAFSDWLRSFTQTDHGAPTSSVVTEEDEYIAEQQQHLKHGFPADVSVLPEEFKLAFALHRDVAADNMR